MTAGDPFEGWAILELMGHRRLAGYVREVELAGAGLLRLDVPGPACDRCKGEGALQEVDADGRPTHTENPCTACDGDGDVTLATQFYSPAALYCLTPTTEAVARRVAAGADPAPVKQWELSARPAASETGAWDEDDDLEDRLP